jgi:hypothetical protein
MRYHSATHSRPENTRYTLYHVPIAMRVLDLHFVRLLCILFCFSAPVVIDAKESVQELENGLWDRSREQASELWEKTKQAAEDTWEQTQALLHNHGPDNGFSQIWAEIVPKLDATLSLEDRHESLPEHSWLSDDQASNRAEINDLLDESIAILTISPNHHYRARIRELEANIRNARKEIAEDRKRRVAAPVDSTLKKTVADYDAAIQELSTRIMVYENELRIVKREFATELEKLGLDISDEQLDVLLTTVVGDDLIDIAIAFDNVKVLTEQLEQLMVESQEDLDSARRYYGMYTVLLQILERMYLQLRQAVDERYVPQIDVILRKTQKLMQETQALQRRNDENRQVLAANLEAQALTRRAAHLYRDYLIKQSRQVKLAQKRLGDDIAVARNTYETVKVSGELVALMQSSQRLLKGLLDRQVPVLRAFENLEMKREFERLTLQLKKDSVSM